MAVETKPLVRWPEGASEEYVRARENLRRAEIELDAHIQRVAAQRHALPLGPEMKDYVFTEGPRELTKDEPVRETHLHELVPDDRSLVMYQMMFSPDDPEACPMCSLWVDSLYGVSHHLRQRVDFVVVSKAPLPKLRDWARRRGWNGLRILSSYDSSFNRDTGSEYSDGVQAEAVSVFLKHEGVVRHVYTGRAQLEHDQDQRGMDLLVPVWHVWDLVPEGRDDWYAGNDYAGTDRG